MKLTGLAGLAGIAPSERRRQLAQLGVRRSRASDLPIWVLAVLLVVAAAVAIAAALAGALSSDLAVGAATAVVTIAGLLVALLQWRAGLAEKALDALYARIALSNQMRLGASDGLDCHDEAEIAAARPDDYRFFVYTEIDSLEYATVRYRFGLGMTDLIADRAIRHFRRRCDTPIFLEIASDCATEGAYFPETKQVVQRIIESRGARPPTMAEATAPPERRPQTSA